MFNNYQIETFYSLEEWKEYAKSNGYEVQECDCSEKCEKYVYCESHIAVSNGQDVGVFKIKFNYGYMFLHD